MGKLFLKSTTTKLCRTMFPIKFTRRVCRLFCCLRSKIFSFRSRVRIPLDRPLSKLVPQGCVAIQVGQEHQRYVIPILYLSHPFITKLLVEAEKEFGYDQRGTLTLPCELDDFEQLKWLIDREKKP
ncbi:hypothetical protein SUGI_0629740 [Cryptomeria japonica]|nr:hypothetical protein SUGI_0629740 [Cryptomeria japonica]